MQHHYIKKTFLGFIGLIIVVGLLGLPSGIGKVGADGGHYKNLPVVESSELLLQASTGVIFGPNATWKYFDKGKLPGAEWISPAFNDSTWAASSAPLGYGNGTERSVVSFGSNSSNKYITTYFRKTFTIDNPATLASVSFTLQRDDGAVVYLNGREIYRTNMPAGTAGYSTLASSCTEESATVTVDPKLFVAGNNTMAVEIHQCNATSSDIAFSLSLNAVLGAAPVQPTATVAVPTAVPTNTPTTAPTSTPTTAPTAAPVNGDIYGADATWKFFDKGTLPASNWFATAFNETAWASGGAILGYGNGNERTVVNYGSDSAHKYITTYFRKTFTVNNPAGISALSFTLVRDDGAVVYLNGREIHRSNMPTGTISNTTRALVCVEEPVTVAIDPRLLVSGVNTMAVEIHQCSDSSSDIAFSQKLTASSAGGSAPQPTPTSAAPTAVPTTAPTTAPTVAPTTAPTTAPTSAPTAVPTTAPTLPPTTGKAYYVSTSGSSSNDGSISKPWSLQHALSHPSAVRAGDTIWVRGGTYTGAYIASLRGASGSPITVRAYPGERVTLRGGSSSPALEVKAAHYVNFWGLEITASYSSRSTSRSESTYGIRVNQGSSYPCSNIKFINMVVHDMQSQGIGWWENLTESEIYGSLFYFNGTTQLDHGIYVHNVSGTKKVVDSIINDNAAFGMHAYAETSTKGLNNLYLEGNTLFSNGSMGYSTTKGTFGIYRANILMGGEVVAKSPTIINNYTYLSGSSGTSLNLGYSAGTSGARVSNNYLMGGNMILAGSQSSLSMSGNTVYAPGGFSGFSTSSYSGNTFLSSKPSGLKVFVRRNVYEPNRANITIYNWSKSGTVSISAAQLSGISIKAGSQYELRNAQNYYGDVITGTYDGVAINVPMTGRSVAQPVGLSFKPASTFPEFGAFILIGK